MNTKRIWGLGGATVVFLLLVAGCISRNGMVTASNNVRTKWADLESVYQRRLDIVQQNLPTVIAGAQQELAVFNALTEQAAALSGTLSQSVDEFGQPLPPSQEIAQQIAAFDQALVNARLYVADNPEMISGQLFSDFMTLLEGSENRINVARRDYNAAVTDYRNRVQLFPGSLIAGIFGFSADQFPYFRAEEGAENAPEIVFPTPTQ